MLKLEKTQDLDIIYRVDVQHIPKNGMSQINAYRSYMVSSNFEILKDLL